MASMRCFNNKKTETTAADQIKKKKVLSIFNSTSTLEHTFVKDISGCLRQTKNYETLTNITKGAQMYNNICNSVKDNAYNGESYEMAYSVKDMNGEIVITSNYDASINVLNDVDTVVVDPNHILYTDGCSKNENKVLDTDKSLHNIKSDLLNNYVYSSKIQMPVYKEPTVIPPESSIFS